MAINVYAKGSNVQLSKNFTLIEFQCQCSYSSCTVVKVDSALVDILQNMRDHYGKALHVCPKHSGYRCESWNARQGGAAESYHTKGMAADISVDGVAPAELARYAESIGVKGIGLYDWGCHIDTRTSKFYWKTDKQIPCSTFGGVPVAPTPGAADAYTVAQFRDEVRQALSTTANGSALLAKTITVAIWKNRYHAVVAPIQRRLNAMGFDCGTVDGKVGPKFVAAVIKLQKAHKLPWWDGVITGHRETWRVLLGL